MEIGRILKEVRVQQGLTSVWVSKQAEISRQSLNTIEKGKNENMTLNVLIRLCNALNITTSNLFILIEKTNRKDGKWSESDIKDNIKKILPKKV